jgi:GT2 family glycosyltransferase
VSDFDPILAIMNPRQIPECMQSLRALEVRKAWLSNYTEWQLQEVIDSIVRDESIHFSHLCLVADDCIVGQEALDAVLTLAREHGDHLPVVTGYCRLDWSHPLVNITKRPLHGDKPAAGAYDFYTLEELQSWPRRVVPTGFVGFALTCMSREMWREFPFRVFGNESRSYASDFNLSMRLRDAGVPMIAARDGLVGHFKKQWNTTDDTPGRELLIGREPARVEVEG